MKRNARSAFNALKKAGFRPYDPVKDRPSWANAHFDLSAEEGDPRLDYWENPCMEEVQESLGKHELYGEWINPGIVGVYSA